MLQTHDLQTRHLWRFRRIFSTFRTQYILMKYNGNIPSFKWRPKKKLEPCLSNKEATAHLITDNSISFRYSTSSQKIWGLLSLVLKEIITQQWKTKEKCVIGISNHGCRVGHAYSRKSFRKCMKFRFVENKFYLALFVHFFKNKCTFIQFASPGAHMDLLI